MPDYYETNKQMIIDYLAAGQKREKLHLLGFELEHFIVDAKTSAFVPYYDYEDGALTGNADALREAAISGRPTGTRPGVMRVLERLLPSYDGGAYSYDYP
ncbi:MAG: hypothetical protein LBS32_07115, partial [Clostridiales Family XIII bacterium]|nr:hypothetical protein [Clostridiales Family XIII bacterium]